MLDENVVENLKSHFDVHPLIFHRSLEKANTAGELFDILDTIPTKYPIVWDDQSYRWVTTSELLQPKDCKDKSALFIQ